MIYNKNISRSS